VLDRAIENIQRVNLTAFEEVICIRGC